MFDPRSPHGKSNGRSDDRRFHIPVLGNSNYRPPLVLPFPDIGASYLVDDQKWCPCGLLIPEGHLADVFLIRRQHPQQIPFRMVRTVLPRLLVRIYEMVLHKE